jgi:hypothetical protein
MAFEAAQFPRPHQISEIEGHHLSVRDLFRIVEPVDAAMAGDLAGQPLLLFAEFLNALQRDIEYVDALAAAGF